MDVCNCAVHIRVYSATYAQPTNHKSLSMYDGGACGAFYHFSPAVLDGDQKVWKSWNSGVWVIGMIQVHDAVDVRGVG